MVVMAYDASQDGGPAMSNDMPLVADTGPAVMLNGHALNDTSLMKGPELVTMAAGVTLRYGAQMESLKTA